LIKPVTSIPLSEIQAARARIAEHVYHSPLVHFKPDDSQTDIYLKLENLQPGGSFKVRGAGNAIQEFNRESCPAGVWTASAGNMGQALAWWARKLDLLCTVIVPDNASPVKVQQIRALGAKIQVVPFDDYQKIQRERDYPGMAGELIHPFGDLAVMAGNGTIGLEILEDLPSVDAVVLPYGGGGLSCGIAAALKALKPAVKIFAAEVDTAAPFTASYSQGQPVVVPYQHSFVNGIGAPFVFPDIWDLAWQLLDGSIAVSPDQIAEAIRLMATNNNVIAEGAGAVATAAALTGKVGNGKIVCIVSGGNIDPTRLARILQGETPMI
jgi:threonine dehydratase